MRFAFAFLPWPLSLELDALTSDSHPPFRALASVQATLGITPSAEGAAPAAGDVEMEAEGAPAEGSLPAAVKATVEETHKA